jgi:hypothetical protein
MHQRDQTHCKRGHPLSGDNLYLNAGKRHCKACRREAVRRRRALTPPKPHGGGVVPIPWQDRFWRYVEQGEPDACWGWTGARNSYGYGRLNSGGKNGRTLKAHRASYEIHYGVDPGELDVCHRCDNPPCVNPAHLFLGDAKANAQDMARKGRAGPQNGQGLLIRKVSDAEVRAIRERAATGEVYAPIAADFGISQTHVSVLARGKHRLDAGGPISESRR